jgi:hypothetical protein
VNKTDTNKTDINKIDTNKTNTNNLGTNKTDTNKTETNPAVLPSGSYEIFATTFNIKHNFLKHEFSVNKLENNHRVRKFQLDPPVLTPHPIIHIISITRTQYELRLDIIIKFLFFRIEFIMFNG